MGATEKRCLGISWLSYSLNRMIRELSARQISRKSYRACIHFGEATFIPYQVVEVSKVAYHRLWI